MSPQRLIVAAAAMWCLAFVATHVPPSGISMRLAGWDKVAHFAIYFCLAASTAMALGLNQNLRIATFAVVLVGLLIYGVVDETTQVFVGRSCEFGDWLADAAGSVVGLSAVWAVAYSRQVRRSAI